MRFNIYHASVIYGGGSAGPSFKLIHKNVGIGFVEGFMRGKNLSGPFKTKEDNMGCYEIYKVELQSLKEGDGNE